MQSIFKLFAKPSADFAALCGLAFEATDRKISQYADKRQLAADHKLASCLEDLANTEQAKLRAHVRAHLFFSGALCCVDYLVPDILMRCSGLASIHSATKVRGVTLLVLSGTLNQWLAAIESGVGDQDLEVQGIFSRIQAEFRAHGYNHLFEKQGRLR